MEPVLDTATLNRRYASIGRGWGEANFDAPANLVRFVGFVRSWGGPGKHMTRDSLYFARILLDTRDEAEIGRATAIIERVLGTQVTREGSPVRGNFPWAAEDAEDQVWDPNWACFNAQTILELLAWHESRLPAALVKRLERSLALCAEHDLARWVSPAYTNIALLTSLCLGAGGARLRDARLTEAGGRKLEELHACVMACNDFDEYNSPTYAGVNLRALSSLKAFAWDEAAGTRIEELWRLQWAGLMRHVHLPTGQVAGPHGRAYGRDMQRHTHGLVKFYLHRALGLRFPLGVEADGSASDLFPALILVDPDCPPDLADKVLETGGTRTVVSTVDACSFTVGLPEFRRHPPYWRNRAGAEAWAELIRSKGTPASHAFRGAVQRTTTWMNGPLALGTVSAAAMEDQTAPLIAHWPQPEEAVNRVNYFLAAMVKDATDGRYANFDGAVFCQAQLDGRVLGLVRFEADPEERTPPRADRAHLVFHVNADANPEVVAIPERHGEVNLAQGAVLGAGGVLCGIRILQARIPGSKVAATLCDTPAPHAHAEGETGVRISFAPVRLEIGQPAYVAFALELCDERTGNGVAGLLQRLRGARVAEEPDRDGRIRLTWGANLQLETGVLVMDCRSWLSPEGAVKTTP